MPRPTQGPSQKNKKKNIKEKKNERGSYLCETHLSAINEIFNHLCGTMQANANLCFTHMLTITFPVLWLHRRDHWKMLHGTYLI